MKFRRDQLLAMLYDGHSVVEDKLVGHTRWSVVHELIFQYEGKLYHTSYSVGATENQPEEPWEYQEMVDCAPMVAVERMVTVYEPI